MGWWKKEFGVFFSAPGVFFVGREITARGLFLMGREITAPGLFLVARELMPSGLGFATSKNLVRFRGGHHYQRVGFECALKSQPAHSSCAALSAILLVSPKTWKLFLIISPLHVASDESTQTNSWTSTLPCILTSTAWKDASLLFCIKTSLWTSFRLTPHSLHNSSLFSSQLNELLT